MLSFHFLFTGKPIPACPLLASEWYSRWPLWIVVKKYPRNVETMEILGNVFNGKGNNTSHVDNRLNKCRLLRRYKPTYIDILCQPVLNYGIECISNFNDHFRRMKSTQDRLIKQCLGLSKRSHNSVVLKLLNIDKVQHRIFLNRESSS